MVILISSSSCDFPGRNLTEDCEEAEDALNAWERCMLVLVRDMDSKKMTLNVDGIFAMHDGYVDMFLDEFVGLYCIAAYNIMYLSK